MMPSPQVLIDMFPHFTTLVLHWVDLCSTVELRAMDLPSIIFAALPLSILMLDLEIAVWNDTDVCWAPPRILQSIRAGLLIHLLGVCMKGLFQTLQLIFAEPLLSRALLVALDLWMTTFARSMPTVVTVVLIYWTLGWGLRRS